MEYRTTLSGEATDDVVIYLPQDEIEDSLWEQIQTMADSDAFEGGKIRIQPDSHWGKGAAIGFTMPLTSRIVPNTIGKDIGCGVYANKITADPSVWEDSDIVDKIDMALRERIPMERKVHGWDRDYHLVNEFPWDVCEDKLSNLSDSVGADVASNVEFFEGYGEDYFKNLCKRIGYDNKRAIKSLGTLGGGNHFIEFGSDSNDEMWFVIHSGSRGIGATIADYWQDQAIKAQDNRPAQVRDVLKEYPESYFKFDLESVSDSDLMNWVQGGMGEDWKNMDAIKEEYIDSDPQQIQATKQELNGRIKGLTEMDADEEALAYLEGEDAYGYYIDMIFAQTYAEQNRLKMAEYVVEALGRVLGQDVQVERDIHSVHNYVDFDDLIIRKGATRAHEGEEFLIPLNMGEGVLIAKGKGNEEWNYSGPHGAGRQMGRGEANRNLTHEEVEEALKHISATERPRDEAPQAYKDVALIKEAVQPTAELTETINVLHNLKAPD